MEQSPKAAGAMNAMVVLDFAGSELFDRTFADGMELVEDAAAYLDGPGRQDSKLLSRNAALAYAGESMRLTTRLMQVASWLLVQRAVKEGDMTAEEAALDRYRIAVSAPEPAAADVSQDPLVAELPNGLHDLVARSERLFERVLHLDRRMYLLPADDEAPHPVLSQQERLRQIFEI